jgi:hypothetical protein
MLRPVQRLTPDEARQMGLQVPEGTVEVQVYGARITALKPIRIGNTDLYDRSCERMRKWLGDNPPASPILIRNEARQMLATGAGGRWKAVGSWILDIFRSW